MINRRELDEIILKNDTNDWWQPELFETNTRHLLPSQIEILMGPPEKDKNHNCFIYAFGLARNQNFITETNGFIYDSLVRVLIEKGELTKTDEPQKGDYVVYRDLKNYPDLLTHIGVLDADKVISKWAWGPLVQHSVWDVPDSYGDNIFYLKALPAEKFLRLYEKYKECNVKPTPNQALEYTE